MNESSFGNQKIVFSGFKLTVCQKKIGSWPAP